MQSRANKKNKSMIEMNANREREKRRVAKGRVVERMIVKREFWGWCE